jgi:hypothetical protein
MTLWWQEVAMEPIYERAGARSCQTHGAAPSLPLPAGRPASMPTPHVPRVIAQQSNRHEGRRSASTMIGMSEEDPTHGTAVAGRCLSMPISASSALVVRDVGGGVVGCRVDPRHVVRRRSDPWHGRRWRLPLDADLRILGSRGAGRWRRGRSTARPPASTA